MRGNDSSALARTKARSTGILHPRNTATKPDVLRRSSRIERLERVVYHEDISGNSERDEKTLAQKISDVLRNLSLISRQKRVGEKSLSIMNKCRSPNGIERGLTLSYGSSSILRSNRYWNRVLLAFRRGGRFSSVL